MRSIIAPAGLVRVVACAAVLPPYELECETQRDPVGIDAPQPRLSWKLRPAWAANSNGSQYRHIKIRPQPVGDMGWVKAKWETFGGPVTVELKRDGKSFHLQAGLPPAMTARVVLPGAAADSRHSSGENSFDTVLP